MSRPSGKPAAKPAAERSCKGIASDDGQRAEMGQQLKLPAGQWATLKAELDYPQSARLEFIVDGRRHP